MVLFIFAFDVRPLLTVNFDQHFISKTCVDKNPAAGLQQGFFISEPGIKTIGWPLESYSFDFFDGCSYDWHPISVLLDLILIFFLNIGIMFAYERLVEV